MKELKDFSCVDKGKGDLVRAVKEAKLDDIKILMDKEYIDETDEDGRTSLIIASENGHEGIVELLIKKEADVNSVSHCGETALMGASKNGHIEIVKLLIEKGANVDAISHRGETALEIASERGHSEILKLLSKKSLWTLDKVNSDGSEALMYAVIDGRLEKVIWLIKKGVDVNKFKINGKTSLTIAFEKLYSKIAYVLFKAGAEIQENIWRRGDLRADQSKHYDKLELIEMLILEAKKSGDSSFFLHSKKFFHTLFKKGSGEHKDSLYFFHNRG